MQKSLVIEILSALGIKYEKKTKGFHFRCVLCGDSKKSKSKKRGWVLCNNKGKSTYYCFNCGAEQSFERFLRERHRNIYNRYCLSNLKQGKPIITETKVKEIVKDSDLIVQDVSVLLKDISFPLKVRQTDPKKKKLQMEAFQFLQKRKIPLEKMKELLVSFGTYKRPGQTNIYLANRIIIPYYFKDIMYAFQGRDLTDKSSIKYITIKEKNEIKLYNYFNINKKEPVYIFEGPFDSFFVDNSMATSGTIGPDSNITTFIKDRISKENRIWVFDNDEDGIKRTDAFLISGERCFVFPKEWRQFKDINKVVENISITKEEILEVIENNTFDGFEGRMKLKFN